MVSVTKHGIILDKTKNVFENLGVLNPGIYQEGNTVHMLYRAAREGNFSSVGYCKLEGPLKVIERYNEPVFYPKESYEFQGIEDPRIVKIEDTFYMTYAAFDGVNVFGAFATSKNLIKWERGGVITPKLTFDEFAHLIEPTTEKISKEHFLFYNLFMLYRLKDIMKSEVYVWDKNLVFFPKKFNGKFALLHRFQPSIQLVYYKNSSELTTEFWKKYIKHLNKHIVLSPKYLHTNSHIGPGCPPIETKFGWLLIYHSAQYAPKGYMYHASAALLDIENPKKVLGRLRKPLFSPTEPWEKEGYVSNIVFPTGTALFGEELYIYYGTADSRVAVASLNINELLRELKNSKP
jgi:predicted GH43/DUF377 family glycosyl hydrolase